MLLLFWVDCWHSREETFFFPTRKFTFLFHPSYLASYHFSYEFSNKEDWCSPNAIRFEAANFMKQQHWLVASHSSFGDWKSRATVQNIPCEFFWLGFRAKNSPARVIFKIPPPSVPYWKENRPTSQNRLRILVGKRHILLSGTELGGSNLKTPCTMYITSWWLSPSSAGCAYMRRASKSAVTGAPRLLRKLFGDNSVNRHQLTFISSQNRFKIRHCSQRKTTLSFRAVWWLIVDAPCRGWRAELVWHLWLMALSLQGKYKISI